MLSLLSLQSLSLTPYKRQVIEDGTNNYAIQMHDKSHAKSLPSEYICSAYLFVLTIRQFYFNSLRSNLCHKHKYYNISIEILPLRICTQYLVAAASAAQSQSSVSPLFLVLLLVLTKQKEMEHDCTACPQIALVFL